MFRIEHALKEFAKVTYLELYSQAVEYQSKGRGLLAQKRKIATDKLCRRRMDRQQRCLRTGKIHPYQGNHTVGRQSQ